MEWWDNFIQKYGEKVEKIFSWVVNITSVTLAIIAFANGGDKVGWGILLTLFAFNILFLIGVTVFETKLYYNGTNHQKTIEAEMEKMKTEKDKEISLVLKVRNNIENMYNATLYYIQYITASLNKFLAGMLGCNAIYNRKMLQARRMKENWEEDGVIADKEKSALYNETIFEATENWKDSMLGEFDHFLGNITSKLKDVIDSSLESQGLSSKVAISVKQFNKVVTDSKNVVGVKVMTTFRDHESYSSGAREVCTAEYSIDRNTDFHHCLHNKYYMNNNVTKGDDTYCNENTHFFEFYNCTVVVPICYVYPDRSHYYGYLACDTLNKEKGVAPFDTKTAQILMATARIIAIYFDNVDYQWNEIIGADFLEGIYELKKRRFEKN